MNTAPPKRMRFLRFSLKTFMVVTVLACLGFGWWRDRLMLRERIATLEEQLAIRSKAELPAWAEGQATGPPDATAGDHPNAWASATPDGQAEWLKLHYARPIQPKTILIHETYNPGAVVKISVFRRDGSEVVVWQGTDPVPTTSPQGVARIAVNVPFRVDRIKIYIDSVQFPGWNEIDAVGLVDARGQIHWASLAEASSTYGVAGPLPTMPNPFPTMGGGSGY